MLAFACVTPANLTTCASCGAVSMMPQERYAERMPLPQGPSRIALRPGDVLEVDASGHVRAIQHATSPTTWTRFKPGAWQHAGWVWGDLEQ